MFEQLFGSKTRVKLLSLFLNNPGRSYYVREITRKIDEQINSVRRELSNLLSIGIIKSEGANNRLYYEVNQKYRYYGELRSVFSSIPVKTKALKETKEEDQITRKLRATGTVELAFLTGVFVRGSSTNIDLFLVGDVNRARVSKVVNELEKELGRELNYTIMTPSDFRYRQSLNDRFLSNIMESKKIVLVDDGDNEPLHHTNLPLPEGAEAVAVKAEPTGEEVTVPFDAAKDVPVAEAVEEER